ncbi:MAG: MurR/RpiR family transcriptional regulator [Lachnospiraceae bacterium]|nr:MurR/RpiR family transcriptional regulator [Lachnospiraceae bacterium]
MENKKGLIAHLNEDFPKLSKGQKALVRFITENTDEAAFLTAAKLGKKVGVSESTVVRFATAVGFEGFPEFQEALSDVVRHKLNRIDRMGEAYGNRSDSEIINSVLQSDIDRISDTMSKVDTKAFEMAVETIINAENIYVIGIRGCAPLAGFLSFYLNVMFGKVHLISTNSLTEVFEQIIRINEKDVLIGIDFPRYSMRTIKALEFANTRNAHLISITDSNRSPMTLYSSCNLLAKSDNISLVDSLVAPLSLINALVVELCMKKTDEVVEHMKLLEDTWEEYQVYNSDEINFIDENKIREYPVTRYGKMSQ